MTDTDDIIPVPGSRRLRGLVIAGGVGLAVAGLAVYLRRRRAPWSADTVDLRAEADLGAELGANGSVPTPGDGRPSPDPAHAPGHAHLAPPEPQAVPVTGDHAGRAYEPGHRDRGGRSAAFRTERGR